MVGDAGRQPRALLDALEVGLRRIEAPHQYQGDAEGHERGPQRNPARITPCGFVVAAADVDRQCADQRQEGDDGEDRPGRHYWAPTPNMNQVMSPATPISIAKA